ncbi:MAG: helix-turn-helix domain-containing protein [Verrucomicrobiota bacterium]
MKTSDNTPQADPVVVGSNIRRIRRAKHMKQFELAHRVGIQPGPMSGIEKGRNIPSGRVLFALAKVLNVPVDAFFDEPGYDSIQESHRTDAVREGRPARRYVGPVSTRMSCEEDAMAEDDRVMCGRIMDAYLALEDICGAHKQAMIPLDLPFFCQEPGFEQLAAQVRQVLGVGQAVVFDYLELFENAGLRVVFCSFLERVESWSYYDNENGNAFFFIRSGMNVERQLFRLIYELGRVYLYTHYGMHRMEQEYGMASRSKEVERSARKFAALFLMPAMSVRTTVGQLGIDRDQWSYDLVLRIKHRFGVSAESFVIRLEELDLIDSELAADFKLKIHRHYADTNYGEPDSSRRILSPNGRLGDLLVCAGSNREYSEEHGKCEELLNKHCDFETGKKE